MSELTLDWAAAEVKHAELRVPLSEKPSKEWHERFERTVRLLGGGQWDEIRIKKGEVRVGGITPGDEDKVHFFLSGVLDQANAAVSPDDGEGKEESASGPDAEMAQRFRAFAPDPEDRES